MEVTKEMQEIVAKVGEIQKSIEKTGATELKVDALAKQFEQFAALKAQQSRAETKHKLFGNQSSYDVVANTMAKALVASKNLDADQVGKWMEKADANLNSTDSGKGSSFKPTTIDPEISKLVDSYGVLRQNAKHRPNVVGTVNINKRATRITVSGKTRPDGATSKGGSTYETVSLSTYEVSAITAIEEKLIWDSPADLVSEAISDLAEAVAENEDDILFNGDGTAADCGFTGLKSANTGLSGADVSVSAGTGLTVDDCLNLRTKVHTSVFGKGKYFTHPFVLALLQTKKASTAGSYFFDITKGSFVLGGSEIVLSPKIDSTVANTMAPIYYGDLAKAVTFGTGRPYEIRILNELYAADGQIGVRMVYDLGIVSPQLSAVAKVLCTA